MTDNVSELQSLQSYNDFMEANAQLMSEVYCDPKLTAAEKMKTFSVGVRNQVILSRDLAQRRAELMRYGIKAGDELKALAFNPMEQSA